THLFIRGDDRNPDKNRALRPGLPRVLTWAALEIEPVSLPPEAHSPGLRPHVLANFLRAEEAKRQAARELLERSRRTAGDAAATAKALAEKMLAAADAQTESLKARAAADRAAVQAAGAEVAKLARAAALAERKAGLALAEENLARALSEVAQAPAGKKA